MNNLLALKSNITSNYLKLGKQPRVFIRIASANLFLATKTATVGSDSHVDSIADFDVISHSIAPYGGMAEVSSFGVRNLELGQRFTLCTEANLSPARYNEYDGAGRIYKESASYAGARNALIGDSFGSPAIVVGRNYISGPLVYQNIRGYLQFLAPSGMTSVEEAVIELNGMQLNTNQNFSLYAIEGNWTALGYATAIYNDLEGWFISGSYSITNLIESWSTTEYSGTVVNKLRLNAAGKALLLSKTGAFFKLMLLSSLDVTNAAAPTSQEYVQFQTDAALKIRYNAKILDNQDAEVYLAYEPVPTSYTDMQLIWKGVVDDYSINDKYLDLELKQNDHKKNVTIPKNIITSDNFPDCPDENLNKAYPIVFGDFSADAGVHKFAIGKETTFGVLSGVRNYAKGLVVNNGSFDQENPIEIKLSDNVLQDINDSDAAFWLSNSKVYARVWALVSLNSSNNTIHFLPKSLNTESFTIAASVPAYKNFGGLTISAIPNSVYHNNNVTDPEDSFANTGYAEIEDYPDYFEVAFPKIGSVGEIDLVEIVFDLTDLNTTGTNYIACSLRENNDIIKIDYGYDGVLEFDDGALAFFTSATTDFVAAGVIAGEYLYISSSVNRGRWEIFSVESTHVIKIYVYNESTNSSGITFQVGELGAELHAGNCNGTGQRKIVITEHIDWAVENFLVRFAYSRLTPPYGKFQIKNVQIRYFTSDFEKASEYFFDSEGERDDNVGTITGTAYLTIEKPPHVIESFARDEMSLVTAEINTTAFDASATALSAWKYAFQINDRAGARDFLHNFYRQSHSKGLWDEQDRLSIKTFNADNNFSMSGTDIPTGLDIFDTTGSPSGDSVTTNPIFELSIIRTGLDEVKNDFVLKYKKNYATGDYLETLYMTNGLGVIGNAETNITEGYLENSQTLTALKTMCATSYLYYQTTNTLEFEADLIRDEATATMLIQYLIERMWKRRYISVIRTKMNAVGFELGDFMNIRHNRTYELFGTATAELKKWEIINRSLELNSQSINLTGIEVD